MAGPSTGGVVRLMSDYSCEYSLWAHDGGITAEELGLSDDLADELLAWQDFFERHSRGNGWGAAGCVSASECQTEP